MQNKFLPDGLWPVMLTPFKENYEVDWTALESLTEYYIQSGAAGLFPICLSSEMYQLTDEERLKITTMVSKIAGRHGIKTVSSGTLSTDMQACAHYIRKVYDAGAAAIIVLTNQLAAYEEEEDMAKRKLEELLHLTGNIPLGIYECPYPYKRLLSAPMMDWLANTGRFFYHKDTSCDPASIKSKIEVLKNTKTSFFNANTATALLSLEYGGNGFSPIGANFYPELYTWLFNEFKARGSSCTLEIFQDQLSLMENVIAQGYPLSAKTFLQWQKLNLTTTCRIQHPVMKAEDYIKLKSVERHYHRMKSEFGI